MLVFLVMGLRPLVAQTVSDSTSVPRVAANRRHAATLSRADRRSIIAAAKELSHRPRAKRDCSHLVHIVYSRAGLPYQYASSDDLYRGTEPFERVRRPQPGDLIVWQGHAGIVINPKRHLFFSALSYGPGIDNYYSHYWKHRGMPRFYRYLRRTDS